MQETDNYHLLKNILKIIARSDWSSILQSSYPNKHSSSKVLTAYCFCISSPFMGDIIKTVKLEMLSAQA